MAHPYVLQVRPVQAMGGGPAGSRLLQCTRQCAQAADAGTCLHFAELALDGTFLGATGCARAARAIARAREASAGTRATVNRLANLLQRLREILEAAAHVVDRAALQRRTQRLHLALDLALEVGRDLVGVVTQDLLRLVGEAIGVVAQLDLLAAAAVLLGVALRLALQPLDLLLAQTAGGRDRDLLLLPRRLIARGNV